MGDALVVLYRFGCPHCGKIIKASVRLAGRKGLCISCHKEIRLPPAELKRDDSWTAQQFRRVVGGEGEAGLGAEKLDGLALLLAQGTCLEYAMGQKVLAGVKPAPHQWRKILTLAAERERLRLELLAQLEERIDGAGDSGITNSELALLDAGHRLDGPLGPVACHILIRFLHRLRHEVCEGCMANPTGMECMYRTMECFSNAAEWEEGRKAKWERACRDALGLVTGKVAGV